MMNLDLISIYYAVSTDLLQLQSLDFNLCRRHRLWCLNQVDQQVIIHDDQEALTTYIQV